MAFEMDPLQANKNKVVFTILKWQSPDLASRQMVMRHVNSGIERDLLFPGEEYESVQKAFQDR